MYGQQERPELQHEVKWDMAPKMEFVPFMTVADRIKMKTEKDMLKYRTRAGMKRWKLKEE